MRNLIKKCESGLTLIEMLTAVSIIVIMGGSTYAVFNTAVKAYHRTQSKLVQAQRSRVAIDRIVADLSHIQTDTSDDMLALYSEDVPEAEISKDIISFVTLVKTDPDLFAAQLKGSNIALSSPLSDVRRVAYYVGPKIPIQERGTFVPAPYSAAQGPGHDMPEQEETLTLYRIVTTTLDPELVIASFMNSESIPTVERDGAPIHDFRVEPLVDGVVNFDLMYIDEEGQSYESWNQTNTMPTVVQVLISVIGEEGQGTTSGQTYTQNQGIAPQDTLTQSTMVYLAASASGE